jgi:hypothetical protein
MITNGKIIVTIAEKKKTLPPKPEMKPRFPNFGDKSARRYYTSPPFMMFTIKSSARIRCQKQATSTQLQIVTVCIWLHLPTISNLVNLAL